MRCSACFSDDCAPGDSLICVVCKLQFHVKCTSWKHLDDASLHRLKHDWHCIFCRKNQIKHALFVVHDTSIGIWQQDNVRRTKALSLKNFERKLLSVKKTNHNSKYILDDMLRSLEQLKTSVGSLSQFYNKCAYDNVKIKKTIGDMSYKLENLCLI